MTTTDFIVEVTIGDGTPFDLNHWNGSVVTGPNHEDTGVVATGKTRNGAVVPWTTKAGARHYAEGLQSIRYPGEDIYLVTYRTFPEGDGPAHETYFVAGPIKTGAFENQEA